MPSAIALSAFILAVMSAGEARANNFYVSPAGSPSNSGSITSPWDIVTGLNNSTVRPGDTVWLRNGAYGSGGYTIISSYLTGTAVLPIYVRQYPGERATIDGGLGISGNYVWYWGFEVTNDNWAFPRTTSDTGSFPGGKPSDAIFFSQGATGNKIINMIVHDGADGIADEQESIATEDYGNLTYNNGWTAPDRGHGHGVYLQNGSSLTKLVTNNINYNSFDIGIQGYGQAGPVTFMDLNGNVSFNAGLPAGHRVDNIAFEGGAGLEQGIQVSNGVFYNPLNATPDNTGYNEFDGSGVDLTLENNYWIGATPTTYTTLQLENYQTLVFTGNTVVGPVTFSNVTTNTWSGNTYYNSAPPSGLDPNSPIYNNNPTGVQTIVQPNKYEPGRANIIVMNWAQNPTVSVNIQSSGLQAGTQFEVLDSQNFWGPAVLTGTYDGVSPIVLPMTLTQVSPITMGFPTPAHTSAEFNVFILLPVGTVAMPPPPVAGPVLGLNSYSLTFNGASGSAVASQNLTVTNTGSANTTLNWTVVSNQSWLSVSPAGGHDATGIGSTVGVSVSTVGLGPGTYQGILAFSDPNALNNAQTVSVTLNVSAPPPPSGTSFITSETLVTVRNDFSGWVGMTFTVGSTPLTVSYLARMQLAGNSGSHVVKLVNTSTGVDVPGGSVTISAAGGTPGLFVYGALATPVVLSANTAYILASQEVYGGDTWYDQNTTVATTADASVTQAAYYYGRWYFPGGAGNTYGPSSFAYTLGGTVAPPPNPTPPPPTPPTNPVTPPASGGTAFVTGQTFGTLRNDYTGWVGMQFKTGSNPLSVTAVGRIVAPGNSGTHTVKIVNASTGLDVPGASAAVATAGGTVGSYVYGTVNSVVLSANTAYYIVTQETGGGDLWYDMNTIVQTTNAGNPVSAVYYYGSSYYPIAYSGTCYGPLNFQYQQTTAPVVTVGAVVSFVQSDISTFGSWSGVYGADGQGIEGDLIRYPSYAQVAISNAQTYTWASSTSDVRALQKASNPTDRIAAVWYSSTNFTIDVNLTDGLTHQIALYALDWDNESRVQRVDVIDANSQTILDTRNVSNFRIGEYLVWNVQGHVTFRVTNLGPGNGVVSGIFFGGK
ncbi:MAG: hypothetical protein ABSG41_18375 [Bryobacteraceae bacterium]|jgi:hypothetical protein